MKKNYLVGVMKTPVEDRSAQQFNRIVDRAVSRFEGELTAEIDLNLEVFDFNGPHLSPVAGAYAPLDFLRLAMAEKLERKIHFLLVITEVELSASNLTYVLALPSQVTNIGIVSTRRLDPSFWGETADEQRAVERLATLLLHTFGHLLNVAHSDKPANVMYDFAEVEELDGQRQFSLEQLQHMRENLAAEARDELAREGQHLFAARQILNNATVIARAVLRANPLSLVTRMPTMITAALSVNIVLFFSAEVWDVGSTVQSWQLILFSVVSILAATFVLYRAFSLGAVTARDKLVSETTVITEAVTVISLLASLLVVYVFFLLFFLLAAQTVFPRQLMTTWPTGEAAVTLSDHLKISVFLAGMGVLAGSLGGRADSKRVVRSILFLDEET